MKPTPTDTSCPPLGDLRRLLRPDLPEIEAAPLRDHLRACLACRHLWQSLQAETCAHTPPILRPADDTSHGMEGDDRLRSAKPQAAASTQSYPFLSPPRQAGEIGWLAHYRIMGVLGEGGMGFVFDAFDTQLHRRVALKVLKPELAANLSFRERFLQEARAAAALPDEHIITIYQVGLEHDVPFLAMKYLHGESLEQRLQREGRLSPREVMRIGREIALGLSAAHDRGLIHRDIKPANLWLETPPEQEPSSGPRLSCEYVYRVKILDFGLARPINDARRLTAAGLIVGTPAYLAPEQARGLPLDHRCDLFSLGIVLYRLTTGILPFDGPDTLAQLTALAVAEPRPIEELAPDAPPGLRQVIQQLLARDPKDRPATARALAEALRALEKGETPTADFASFEAVSATKTARLPRSSSRRRWLLAGGLLGLLLLGGMLLWRDFRPNGGQNAIPPMDKEPIKVGILFSLRGPMASGGAAAHDAAQLAIDELNRQGGLLGRPLVVVDGDGESDYVKFAEVAEKFITQDHVCAIFGCRASSNRKAVRPIVEKYDNVLFYPMQFEGLEDSPNIIYLGAAPNQQMFPAIDYLLDKQNKRRLFLVGSDYIYPRAANAIVRDYVSKKYPDARVLAEEYIPFGSTEVQKTIRAIVEQKPDLILNTINGDSNSAFFRSLHQAGLRPAGTPVLSFSMGENDLLSLGEVGAGHYAAWSYFQSIDRPENRDFVRKFRAAFGSRRVVSDPMETVYFGVHLWAQAVQAAGSVEPRAVRAAIKGRLLEAPEGTVRIDRDTRYTWRVMRLGRVGQDGQFDIVFDTAGAIPPEPFPSSRPRAEWATFLHDLYTGWGNRWQAPER
jgi:urea transport system substrate-binding protein